MDSLINVYSAQANFDTEKYYTVLYNSVPCKYSYQLAKEDEQIDCTQICYDKIKHLFKNVIGVRQNIEDVIVDEDENKVEIEYTQVSELPEEFEDILGLSEHGGATLTVAADDMVIFIRYNTVAILYDYYKSPLEVVKKLVEDILACFPKSKQEEKIARVGLIKYSNGEYYTSFSNIKKTHINIEENYNDDFANVYKDTIDFLKQRESGLVLFWGTPGTGKTTMIRHLCSTIAKDYVIVPNSVASRLGDPDFISYITSCKDYVFILEDCEQLLVDREDNPWNNAITTILNMADGLLSDIVNIKFICTFNAAIDKIDPALLRKGRCFAKYEFTELCKEKVAHLNEKYDLKIPEIKSMTLAEIYNAEKTDYSEQEKKTNKIGF